MTRWIVWDDQTQEHWLYAQFTTEAAAQSAVDGLNQSCIRLGWEPRYSVHRIKEAVA